MLNNEPTKAKGDFQKIISSNWLVVRGILLFAAVPVCNIKCKKYEVKCGIMNNKQEYYFIVFCFF